MALTYGFFDSINKDRMYNADQFSSFFDGIINDGIYEAVGDKFDVKAYSGMQLTVGTGRAWFDHTWTLNTTKILITISAADAIYPRIDAVVLEVNKNDRRNYIKVVKGSPAVNPVRPALTRTAHVKQYALAYVTVPKLATTIYQSNIAYVVGDVTPLVSAILLSGIPGGGEIGQVLAKKSSESGSLGWYDFDKLPYNTWYLADGVNESSVLGAYGFKNAGTEVRALKNINEKTNYPLTKSSASVMYASEKGFTIPGKEFLNNETLRNANAVTVAFRFTDITNANGTFCLHGGHVGEGNQNDPANHDLTSLYINIPYGVQHFLSPVNPYFGCHAQEYGVTDETYHQGGMRQSSIRSAPGVLSATFRGKTIAEMYYNGTKLELSPVTTTDPGGITMEPYGHRAKLIGGDVDYYCHWTYTTLTIQCAVFYSIALSDRQHAQLYRQIESAFG